MGPTHQAVVPDHPTFPPYVKGKPQDNLLWSPRHTTEERGRRGRWRKGGRCGERREVGEGVEEGREVWGEERAGGCGEKKAAREGGVEKRERWGGGGGGREGGMERRERQGWVVEEGREVCGEERGGGEVWGEERGRRGMVQEGRDEGTS